MHIPTDLLLSPHLGRLQIGSPAAIDSNITVLEEALSSEATLFIGGHGKAASAETVRFQIDYQTKMKATLGQAKNAEAFVAAMKQAYPDLPGEKELEGVANALYK